MSENKNYKVLIIDDEPDILELMDEEFKYFGFQTLTAICGKDAVTILEKETVDIIVSDYKMPNGNGLSVLSFVNKMPGKKPLFYFVSGQADVSIEDAISAGARKFFSKPFDLDELIKEITVDAKSSLG